MFLKNRIIFSDNGTRKDFTHKLNNYISQTEVMDFVSNDDYLYLGSEAAFNHRWIELETVNTSASTLSEIAVWDGDEWKTVVEIIDLTKNDAGDTSLSKSGIISWVTDKDQTLWVRDDTDDTSNNQIIGLEDLNIYDLFWVRLKWSADLDVTTELKAITHKFADDEDLFNLWPEFDTDEARERYRDGTTTYDQVHFESAQEIIKDLKRQGVLATPDQILEWSNFRTSSVHKAAEILFRNFGKDWDEEWKKARQAYTESIKIDLFDIDQNNNARLDPREIQFRSGNLIR